MSKKLSKELGLLDVFAICTGAMISSGFFLLPGLATAKAGPAAILCYIFAGILILPSMMSIAELSTAMPRAGGTYFFISRSLGPMFGTIDGVGDWLALIFKSSFALVGIGAYLTNYVGLSPTLIAVGFGLIFMVINLVGSKQTSGLQIAMVGILVGILALFIIRGAGEVDTTRFNPFLPFGKESLLATTGFVFISFIGLTKVASVSEEVRRPHFNIPIGMSLSLLAAMIIYGLGIWIVIGTVPADTLRGSLTPIADSARIFSGTTGVILISIAAIMAFATTGNAGIMSASRYLLAMGRDRVIPHRLSRISSRFKTPKNAILVTSAIVLLIVLLVDAEHIAKLASTYQIVVFALANIAVIVMRESGLESYDPGFKSPLYPYLQVIGILTAVVLIPEMGLLASLFALVLMGLGVVWYNLYVRRRVDSVGAVAHMAERIAERMLSRDAKALGLNKELREILKEKGIRGKDPFEKMVAEANFIELDCKCHAEEVLDRASTILSKRSGVSHDLILGALLERSRLGETPAEAGIALPHLLLDQVDDFYLVIARSVPGLDFPMADQSIHAVFVLLGNRKNPAQHLRLLAEIARRAEDPNFLDKWISAENVEEIVDELIKR